MFNVHDYGGADSGDATAGVLRAAEAALRAGGGIVYFPPGSYELRTGGLPFLPAVRYAGSGLSSRLLWDQTTVPAAFSVTGRRAVQYAGVENLRLVQTNPSPGGTAVEASYLQFAVLRGLVIDATVDGGRPNIGVSFASDVTHYNKLEDSVIFVDGPNAVGIRFDNGANSNEVRNVRVLPSTSDATQIGIHVNAYAITLDHPDIEHAAGTAILIGSGALAQRPTVITSPYLEANGHPLRLAEGAGPPAMGAQRVVIRKTVATEVRGSAVLSADPHLHSVLLCDISYRFEFELFIAGPSGAAFAFDLSAPPASSILWSHDGAPGRAVTTPDARGTVALGGPAQPQVVRASGTVTAGSTQQFALRWSQQRPKPSPVVLREGSTLVLDPMA